MLRISDGHLGIQYVILSQMFENIKIKVKGKKKNKGREGRSEEAQKRRCH